MFNMTCLKAIICFFQRQILTISKFFRKDKSEYNDIEFVVLDLFESPNNKSSKQRINARGEMCV